MANLNFLRSRPRSASSGQAMVEMAVALIVIMVVLVALLQIGALCRVHSRTMAYARHEVAGHVIGNDFTRPLIVRYILNWRAGRDKVTYSRDDTPVVGTPSGQIARYARDGELEALLPGNPVSSFAVNPNPGNNFALVRGTHSAGAPILPVARRLLYSDSPRIDVRSEAWLTWTGGLY